jgi:hypothetical protein
MDKDDLNKLVKTGEQIVKEMQVDTRRADEIAAAKREYTHTRTEDLTDGCPIGNHRIPDACFDCDYTDRVGFCVHPVNINEEIKAGRALPMKHDPTVPEVVEDRKRQVAAFAFRAVDKR